MLESSKSYSQALDSTSTVDKDLTTDSTYLKFNKLLQGKAPFYFVDFDISKFIGVNKYEGLRLGIDAQTNNKISKGFFVGGYFAYSLKEKVINYGSRASFSINKKHEFFARVSYTNDFEECGSLKYYFDNKIPIQQRQTSETYRKLLVDRMYYQEKLLVSTDFRFLKYSFINLGFVNRSIQEFVPYKWAFTPEPLKLIKDNYSLSELNVNLKLAFREKYFKIKETHVPLRSKYPIVLANITKGFDNILNGEISYVKYSAKVIYNLNSILGETSLTLNAGKISAPVPFSLLYNISGNYSSFSVYSANSFSTMRPNEFSCNEFVSAHVYQNIGYLPLGSEIIKPFVVLSSSAILGSINNNYHFIGPDISAPDKTYFESGILLNNIIHSEFNGVGLGCFYRYGAYHLSREKSNFAYTLNITFNL